MFRWGNQYEQKKVFKIEIYFLLVCVGCMCVYVCLHGTWMNYPWNSKENIISSGARVSCICELRYVSTWYWTQVLWKINKYLQLLSHLFCLRKREIFYLSKLFHGMMGSMTSHRAKVENPDKRFYLGAKAWVGKRDSLPNSIWVNELFLQFDINIHSPYS